MEQIKTIISAHGGSVSSLYKIAGMKEREYLYKLYDPMHDAQFMSTPDSSKAYFDGTLCHKGKQYILEAKVRTASYDAYLLEEQKYDNLMAFAKECNMDVLYVNFTPSGTYVWNLSDMTRKHQIVPFKQKLMTEKSVEHTGLVKKYVTNLPQGNATVYPLKVQKSKEEMAATISMVRQLINK